MHISRSRPYHKNDNCFVEENNSSLVRAYIGHGRLDTISHLLIMREIYEDLTCYHNFFQPVKKTIQKVQVDDFRYRRVFDKARPPFAKHSSSGSLGGNRRSYCYSYREVVHTP